MQTIAITIMLVVIRRKVMPFLNTERGMRGKRDRNPRENRRLGTTNGRGRDPNNR
jgi:hypothetical protein